MNLKTILTYGIGVPVLLCSILYFPNSPADLKYKFILKEEKFSPAGAYIDRHGNKKTADPNDPNTWPGL